MALSDTFLSLLNDELLHFYAISEQYNIPVSRPNSMNSYGVILNEIGMRDMTTSFQQKYLWPIARYLFPKHGTILDDHHSFLVRYKTGEDLGLDMHIDDSDITFNVCLGDVNFTGANLVFCGMFGEADHRHVYHSYTHELGRAVLHLGSRRHGAEDIRSGTRTNWIIWSRNSHYRNSYEFKARRLGNVYQTESGPPDMQCLSFTHDRDFTKYKQFPAKQNPADYNPWCPPVGKEYNGYYDSMDEKLPSQNEL